MADTTLAKEVLGFYPEVSLNESLNEIIVYIKQLMENKEIWVKI